MEKSIHYHFEINLNEHIQNLTGAVYFSDTSEKRELGTASFNMTEHSCHRRKRNKKGKEEEAKYFFLPPKESSP